MGNSSDVGRDKRVKAKFLDGNTELGQLAFVGLDHVGVSLSDLLELSLDLTDGLVLKLLHLLEGASDHAKSLRVNPCSGQDLVGLGILRLQALLNGLELLLKDQIAQASLAMNIIDHLVEFLKQLLLLLFDVLVLLQTNFILPLSLLVNTLLLHNLGLLVSELLPHSVVRNLQFLKPGNLLLDLLKRLHNLLVLSLTDHLLPVCSGFSNLFSFEIRAKGANHVHVQARDVVVVIMDILVLLVVLGLQLLNSLVLLSLNLGNLSLPLGFHVFSEASHLGFVLLLDFVGDALVLLSLLGG